MLFSKTYQYILLVTSFFLNGYISVVTGNKMISNTLKLRQLLVFMNINVPFFIIITSV
jgi:hypothetical protein